MSYQPDANIPAMTTQDLHDNLLYVTRLMSADAVSPVTNPLVLVTMLRAKSDMEAEYRRRLAQAERGDARSDRSLSVVFIIAALVLVHSAIVISQNAGMVTP